MLFMQCKCEEILGILWQSMGLTVSCCIKTGYITFTVTPFSCLIFLIHKGQTAIKFKCSMRALHVVKITFRRPFQKVGLAVSFTSSFKHQACRGERIFSSISSLTE